MRVSRGFAAVAVAVAVLAVPACGGATGEESGQEPTAASPTSDGTGGTDGEPTAEGGPTVADPDRAVDPPGRFEPPLEPADLLVVSPRGGLSDAVVERVGDLEGVTAVARIATLQVSIENKVYTIAAVEPATYRRFTTIDSAQLQDQWDRVAGGEVAVRPELQKRLPIDEDGYLDLGSGEDAHRLHVGAFAPQVPTVDMVVNSRWGEELGMTAPNGLLVSGGSTGSAQPLVRPVQRIVGKDVSVQRMDIAARRGLDTSAIQTAVFAGTFADAVGTFRYTVVGGRVVPDPAWVREHIVTEAVPILGTVTCNKHLMPQLKAALAEIQATGLADKINPREYAGCYYPRFIAGSTTLSNHAFGLALDINVPGNQRGTVGEIDRGVVAIFKRWGFGWGGDWGYTDPMHFELARIVAPG